MDQIAAGEMTRDGVVGDSRELLHQTTTEIEESREDLAKVVWAGMDEDKFLGPCKVCAEAGRAHEDGSPNRLRIIELKGGKRMYGCEGWNRDDPESPDSCPVSGPLPGRGYELWRLEEQLLDLRRDAEADGQGLPRPPLEALPQRRLPLDGGDAREAGRARGGARRQEGDEGEGRGQRRGRRASPRRRRPTPGRAGASGPARPASQAAAKTSAWRRCSSPSRGSTARARAPRRGCWPRRSARRPCWSASRAGPTPPSGSASCSPTPRSSSTRWPSCCSSAPPGPIWSAASSAPPWRAAATSSRTASRTPASPTRGRRAGSAPGW